MKQCLRETGSWQGEIWNRRKNGEVYPQWLTITAVQATSRELTHYVGTLIDITQRKAAEDEIKHLAFYDPLTQLPNRRLLLDRLQQALVVERPQRAQGALLFIDLDNFKTLNDTQGHDKGDLLLQQVAAAPEHLRARGRHRGAPGRRRIRGDAGGPERGRGGSGDAGRSGGQEDAGRAQPALRP